MEIESTFKIIIKLITKIFLWSLVIISVTLIICKFLGVINKVILSNILTYIGAGVAFIGICSFMNGHNNMLNQFFLNSKTSDARTKENSNNFELAAHNGFMFCIVATVIFISSYVIYKI